MILVIMMEMPQRKPNRITDYDYSQNGAYFVTLCTQDRKPVLSSIVGDDAHIVPKSLYIIWRADEGHPPLQENPSLEGFWFFYSVLTEVVWAL